MVRVATLSRQPTRSEWESPKDNIAGVRDTWFNLSQVGTGKSTTKPSSFLLFSAANSRDQLENEQNLCGKIFNPHAQLKSHRFIFK